MKRAIICCGIIYQDIENVLKSLPYEADIIQLPPKLHNHPDQLTSQLQEEIDKLSGKGYDEIVLTYFLCGNGLLGITARDTPVAFGRCEDCIDACVGHHSEYKDWRRSSIFESRGWLNNGDDQTAEVRAMRQRYDEETVKELYSEMYVNYKKVIYMKMEDTIDPEDLTKAKDFADLVDLDFMITDGTLDVYKDLLAIEHSDNVCVLAPGEKVELSMFNLMRRI